MTFVLLVACAVPAIAPAQPTSPSLRFKVHAWSDGAFLGSGVAVALIPVLWPSHFPHATCAPCDPARLWSLDRGTVGPLRSTADVISTGALASEAVLSGIFLAASRRGERGAFLEDATVMAQAVTLTAAATQWAKVLFHRPRPYLYTQDASAHNADDGRSLPSSHTSIAFAAAAAYASILHRRGLAKSHALQIGVLFGTAAITGAFRIAAHQHFPTDVAAGAALGFAIGWYLPQLHPTQP